VLRVRAWGAYEAGAAATVLKPTGLTRAGVTEGRTMDFEHSERREHYADKVAEFMKARVTTNEKTYYAQLSRSADYGRGGPENQGRDQGRSKVGGAMEPVLPDKEFGAGPRQRDYAAVAGSRGRASSHRGKVFNATRRQTGERRGAGALRQPREKEKMGKPPAGRRDRSAFAMTEARRRSSDATNMRATAEVVETTFVPQRSEVVRRAAGDPRCKFPSSWSHGQDR